MIHLILESGPYIEAKMIKVQQIKAARALLGWSQNDLADAADISIASVRRIECQTNYPKAHSLTLLKIETALRDEGIRFSNDATSDGVSVIASKNGGSQ